MTEAKQKDPRRQIFYSILFALLAVIVIALWQNPKIYQRGYNEGYDAGYSEAAVPSDTAEGIITWKDWLDHDAGWSTGELPGSTDDGWYPLTLSSTFAQT